MRDNIENAVETVSGKRRKNRIPDVGGPPNGILTNPSGTTIKRYDKNGIVENEFNQGHGPHFPKDEQKDRIHDYMPDPSNRPLGKQRMPARKPKKNELKKDF